jgi:hypothetical protein
MQVIELFTLSFRQQIEKGLIDIIISRAEFLFNQNPVISQLVEIIGGCNP